MLRNRALRSAATLLDRVTEAAVRRPYRFILAGTILFGASVYLASGLEVRSSFEELLPSDLPSVVQVKELRRRVGGDGSVLVLIDATGAPEQEALAQAEAFAPKLAQDYLALGPDTIRSVEWNVRPVQAWYIDHWPLFTSLDDLKQANDAIKQQISREKKAANPLLHLGEAQTEGAPAAETSSVSARARPAWLDPKHPLPREEAAQAFARYKNGFLVHPDGRSITLVVRPAGTALGVAEARALLDRMRAVADTHKAELDAGHLRIAFGGSFPLFVAEYETILRDMASTVLLCVSLVLISLFLFYRDLRSTLSLGVAVIAAVATTLGLTRVAIGYLTTQTAFLGSIVVGNGINYGLIYLARVGQLRRKGIALAPACVDGARTAARATLLAAMATSVSFGTLIVAANRGFRHFGFIGGIGMLLCWIFTFAFVPALLAAFERLRPLAIKMGVPGHRDSPASEATPPGRVLTAVFARPRVVLVSFAVLAALALGLFIRNLPDAYERNLQNLTNEIKGHESLLEDHERANAALGKSIAGAIALLPTPEDADRFCEEIKRRRDAPPDAPQAAPSAGASMRLWPHVLQGCETISSIVPSQQAEKLAVIHEMVRRLSDAVIDAMPADQAVRVRQVRADLAAQRALKIEDAPPTLLDRFRERDGALGHIAVVTARYDAQLELEPNLIAFAAAVRNVPVGSSTYDATGENVIFADLLKNIEVEGPRTTFLSLVGVCLLVGLFLRKLRPSALVIVTLVTGIVLMGGVATALNLKINFFNFIVFPITFGVAVDYGANVVVRALDRGGRALSSLREVGPAVALCSWTSIIGYGSLVFALNRALRSFGWYAVVGEITSILTALILLPVLLLLLPRFMARTVHVPTDARRSESDAHRSALP